MSKTAGKFKKKGCTTGSRVKKSSYLKPKPMRLSTGKYPVAMVGSATDLGGMWQGIIEATKEIVSYGKDVLAVAKDTVVANAPLRDVISSVDGPAPVADVIGFGIVSVAGIGIGVVSVAQQRDKSKKEGASGTDTQGRMTNKEVDAAADDLGYQKLMKDHMDKQSIRIKKGKSKIYNPRC